MKLPKNLIIRKKQKTLHMNNRLFISEKNEGFEIKFKSLNNDEMNNLRGGVSDLPPTGGEDFPIDPFKK